MVDKLADHPNQIDKSPYAYGWNNPTNLIDPDGNCPICPFLPFIGAMTERQVITTGIFLVAAVGVVSNANKYPQLGYSVRQDGTRSNVQLNPMMLNSNKKTDNSGDSNKSKEDKKDYLNGGNKIADDKIKSPPSKRGNAPVGDDSKPVELNHRDQTPDGPLDEMTRQDHRGGENYKKNHSNTGSEPSKID
ncbi:HNH/ENDO VII family nuclease [Sphingobacterium anhuiense]|uniref:HNH/ENDO VII family nuclease n=1 Tax=Sphingobacterium anhuiense TaxID=493780 RepID=A0ABW5YWB3_9SPHI